MIVAGQSRSSALLRRMRVRTEIMNDDRAEEEHWKQDARARRVMDALERFYFIEAKIEQAHNGPGDQIGAADPWAEELRIQARKVKKRYETWKKHD